MEIVKQVIDQIKLNKNVEVINDRLWAVNFDYLKNGWINGISIDKLDTNSWITVVGFENYNSRIIVLNNTHKFYNSFLPIFKYIMNLSISDMKKDATFYKYYRFYLKSYKKYSNKDINQILNKSDLSSIKELFSLACQFEIQRRKEENI